MCTNKINIVHSDFMRTKSKGGVDLDLVAMGVVSMLTNYAHCDWLTGEGSLSECSHIQIKAQFKYFYNVYVLRQNLVLFVAWS